MAEFKLGRIRYTWRGAWNSSAEYIVDDIVSYKGKSYVCLTKHLSSSNFYTDLEFLNSEVPPVADPKWELMLDGYRWRDAWTTDTFYSEGDLVRYFGKVYICTQWHTSAATVSGFEVAKDAGHWDVYTSTFEWKGVWNTDTYYKLNDIVKVNGIVYLCTQEHISSDDEDGIDVDLANWDIYAYSDKWQGDWTPGTRYQINDVIRFGGNIYRSSIGHTSSILFEDDTSNWSPVHVGIDYKSDWIPATESTSERYKVGDVVKYGGQLWRCTVAHDSLASFSELNWEIYIPGDEYEASWSNATVYQPGDVARYGGYLYKANTLNQNKVPSLEPTDWTLVKIGANIRGAWSELTAYRIGDTVNYGGNLYTAVDDNLNETPAVGTDTNTDFWELVIPGNRWHGDWTNDFDFAIGDIVHWNYKTYTCINVHTSELSKRPDNDLTSTYWELLILGDSANKLSEVGDIKTFDTEPVAVNIGSAGRIIKESNGLPVWSQLNVSEKVYYVAPTGVDTPDRGTTLNDPWRSIRYACDNITGPASIFVKTGLYQEVLPIIVPAGVAIIGDEIRGVVVEPAPTLVPSSDVPNTLAAIEYFKTLFEGLVIENPNIASVSTQTRTNINTIYSILNNELVIAPTVGTNDITTNVTALAAATDLENLKTSLANQVVENVRLTYPTFNYSACARDIEKFVEALAYDIRYVGNYKSKQAAYYYVNAADGDKNKLSNMFYLRDSTGLRNMTFRGLSGSLTPAGVDVEETRRVIGGAYVSLDPGWGPADNRTWITNRSPYIQNCTTFGAGCIGMKLDGDVHSGGLKSMVANDFTQILSDGIGVWVNKDAKTELVSVFTYYNHIGYLAENGGKIRATNGNNSYGRFGAVSEGVNPTESPITAVVNNRYYDATVGAVLCDPLGHFMKLFFSNAGQNYTSAAFDVTGAGIGISLVGDEIRNGAISEVRIVDPGDSTIPGGGSYLFTTNSAQGGDNTSIIIAGSDINLEENYLGMRVFLSKGTGVGQYGYITAYNDVSKVATIAKESDDTPGWDHIVPGTTIATVLDTTTTYAIEPRVTFSSPGNSVSTGNFMPSLKDWRSVAAGNNMFVAIGNEIDNGAGNFAAYTTNGTSWSASSLPAEAIWTDVTYGNGTFVAISRGTRAAYSTNGTSWTSATLPNAEWSSVTYGNGKFVAVASGGTRAAYSTNGTTWTLATLPEGADWSSVVYGKGKFVAVSYSDSTTTSTAYSTDGITWSAGSFAGGCSCIAYGQNRFVAFDGAVSGDTIFTSTDGITWSSIAISSPQNWKSVVYGGGRFVALADSYNSALTSTDGLNWTTISIVESANWTSVAYGTLSGTAPKFIGITGNSVGSTTATMITSGITAQARVEITSGRISQVNIWETGSGYVSAPSMLLTDPNNTSDVTVDIRINNGVLGNPSIVNAGSGYQSQTTFATVTGDGFMDSYQLGKDLIVENLSRLPRPGDNLNINGIDDYTYKVTSVTVLEGTSAPYTAKLVIIKGLDRAESPTHGTLVEIREQYSQCRITGHDLLLVGLGNVYETNFPDTLHPKGTVPSPENEVIERNGGRVFYTSTNDLGNFRVGELFAVEQATGTVTLNAEFFELQGLEELKLGGVSVGTTAVVVREFSTDSTFTADSNNIVPTQRAIKAYLTRRVSGGGSDAITGGLQAGLVVLGPNEITTTVGPLTVDADVYFTGGVSGMMLAQSFFQRRH